MTSPILAGRAPIVNRNDNLHIHEIEESFLGLKDLEGETRVFSILAGLVFSL